jgi:hypothetical protein
MGADFSSLAPKDLIRLNYDNGYIVKSISSESLSSLKSESNSINSYSFKNRLSPDNITKCGLLLCLLQDVDSLCRVCRTIQTNENDESCPAHRG